MLRQLDETCIDLLLNPAYLVVREDYNEIGHIVKFNQAFEAFTGHVKIDKFVTKSPCCGVIHSSFLDDQNVFHGVCAKNCPFQGLTHPVRLDDVWIDAKKGVQPVRKNVDIIIMPFERDDQKYTMHILHDRGVPSLEPPFRRGDDAQIDL
jgi:hypothetical protein